MRRPVPEETPDEDWMAHLRDLGKSLDANLVPCPVCGEPVEATDLRCKFCGHSLIEEVQPEPVEEETFQALLRSTLRTTQGVSVRRDDDAPEAEMWEALEAIVEVPTAEAVAPSEAVEAARPSPFVGMALLLVGLLAYAVPLAGGWSDFFALAAMALGAVSLVLALSILLGRTGLRVPTAVGFPRLAFPFLLLAIGLAGYVLSPALLVDPVLVVPGMVMGALLILLGVLQAADLLRPAGVEG